MASSSDPVLCASCELNSSTTKPKPGVVNCIGCQQVFCIHHIGEHRQELSAELEAIVCKRNTIQEALESCSFDVKAELALIDTWINETIDLVYKAAANARQKLENLMIKRREDLKSKCQELTSQIESFHRSENYFEHDLANLRTSFGQLAIAKNKSNIKIDFSDVADVLDKAIQVNSDLCAPNICSNPSFIEKILISTKSTRQVSLSGLYSRTINVSHFGDILVHEHNGFLFIDSDDSMRSLSTEYSHGSICNIRWSTYLGRFLYYVSLSCKEPTTLISFNASATTMVSEEVVTPKTEGAINQFAVFGNSLLLVCQYLKSTQTIEEWSLQGRQWHQAEQPKYRWRSPLSCLKNERIQDIVFDRDYIALLIRTDKITESFRFELRNRKMVVQGRVTLYLECRPGLSPTYTLQPVPDGWLLKSVSFREPTKFVLISHDLNIYEQSYLDNLELANVVLVDTGKNREKLLVAHHRMLPSETSSTHESKFLFYEIK